MHPLLVNKFTDVSGTESMTVTTGSAGQFSAGAIDASGGFILDMSAKELSTSGEVLINAISSSGAVTLTIGQSEANASGAVVVRSYNRNQFHSRCDNLGW